MQNPILQALTASQAPAGNAAINPQIARIVQMWRTLKAAQNPQALFAQMMQNNPQMKTIMDAIQQNGGDPKKAFYAMAQQKGINPDDILNALK